ncbi:MAG: ABC transporter permease [Thiocapsa sp.]|jgi:NitT/TauT family transport system permease protein|nr:ABC transporter permease [Thiocapsa sp.]MCG6897739.1 ABC transporter permease [Thiocapsa sp.]MCG6985414.1 ABC transporter permease [Thiocapsa sp.]
MRLQLLRIILPVALFAGLIWLWEWSVAYWEIKPFVLPPPSAILAVFETDGPSLLASAWTTLGTTLAAFVLAVISGILLATLFASSRIAEAALSPYAVTLQVTPVVAIAPLIIVWVGLDKAWLAVLILAWIVAFFPVLASATAGLKAVDPNLRDLFRLYHASFWQTFRRLMIPSSLPYLLSGIKTAGGLALVGAVVAEFAAASGNTNGLAWRILEAGNRLQIAKMFAALMLLALMGVILYALLSFIEWLLLHRWHGDRRNT